MSTSYFYSAVFGLCAGTALLLVGLPLVVVAGLSLLLTVAFLIVGCFVQKNFFLYLAAIFLVAASIGAIRVGLAEDPPEATVFDAVTETPIKAAATVISRPSVADGSQQFTARITSVKKQSASTTIAGPTKTVVYGPAYPQLSYGDQITLSGQLQKPEAFTGNNDRAFAYPQYLARKDIYYEMNRPEITRTNNGGGNVVFRNLAQLQDTLLTTIKQLVPKPESGLVGGVLLGAEDELGEDLIADFRATSVVHVVVLSGFHVTVVATAIGKGLLLAGIPLAGAMLAAGIGIALFALLVGLSPTIIRASIMAVFALIARVSGRRYAAGRGLSIAVVVMVFITPEILLYDPSFQLSVAATAGLIMFGDHINKQLTWIPEWWGLREVATATISAQLMVLPLILYHMGTLSLVSLPANLLVLPVVPVLMAAAAITVMAGLLSPTLGFLPAVIAYLLAGYVISVVQWFASIPAATVSVPAFPAWLVFVMYAGIVAVYFHLQSQQTHPQLLVPADN